MRYVVDFGTANAGGSPTFTTFDRLDTLAAMTPPTIADMGDGQYYFDVDWSATTATSIAFKITLAGIELSDVISSPDVVLPGATTASAGVSSLAGYSTAGVIVARAGTQVGILNLNPQAQAAYDPFASTDPNVVRMLELLSSLGSELTGTLKAHHIRECTITTAGGATSYALPADYVEMVPETAWDRTGMLQLDGPVTSRYAQSLKAWNGSAITNIPFRIEGNRMTFPVDPGDGLTIVFEYYSEYWIQTAASGTGPDADHPTLSTDYVLFDPLLMVLGLRLRFRESKGMDTAVESDLFARRLAVVKGRVGGAKTLSLEGRRRGGGFLGYDNLPDSGYGA